MFSIKCVSDFSTPDRSEVILEYDLVLKYCATEHRRGDCGENESDQKVLSDETVKCPFNATGSCSHIDRDVGLQPHPNRTTTTTTTGTRLRVLQWFTGQSASH